jgi:glycerol-3-phosphate O-acyltransferase
MNEIVDKPAVASDAKAAPVSSAINAVPIELELRIAKAKLVLTAQLAATVNDGQQETALKRDALKARLSELEHHLKSVPDGFPNISPAVKAVLEAWLAQP